MSKNYMTYPMKNMRITCRYDEGSHRNHCTNVSDGVIDYPIDDGGIDTGRDPIYCPCDEMQVTGIFGLDDSRTTNTIWLVSTSPVITPTFTDIAYVTLTHSNNDDLRKLKIGQIFKRGEIVCYEGTDGAVANHIHMTCGRGSFVSWKQNSNGSWIMAGDSKKPEDIFYVDKSFTKVLWGGSLPWKYINDTDYNNYVGTPVERNTKVNQVEVLVDNLNARSNYSTDSTSYGYIKKGIYNILDEKENEGYLWVKVESYWIATNKDWTNYLKKEEPIIEPVSPFPKLIFTCTKTGKYLIFLEEGKKLYIE